MCTLQERHTKRLQSKRTNQKTIQDEERQRLRDAEKERQQEAQRLKRIRSNNFGTENKLIKPEKQKDSELKQPKHYIQKQLK